MELRELSSLKDFYKGYKQIDKAADEIIEKIIFTPPQKNNFNFEKVSKRTHLDIASVNTACLHCAINADGMIEDIHIVCRWCSTLSKILGQNRFVFKRKKNFGAKY